MCVSVGPADFRNTAICMYEADPAYMGHPTRVMLYQNRTLNRMHGPNAMLLHIDAAMPMGQANFVPTTDFPRVLEDMVESIRPRTRGEEYRGELGLAKAVQVFDVGIYTVVLADDASAIASALDLVPANKRPAINRELFDFYARSFPGYSVALCCFDQSAQSEPLMFWWQPRDSSVFRMPALDEHTGRVPNLNGYVDVDHWLIAGSYRMEDGMPVYYRDPDRIPEKVRPLLPNRVIGLHVRGEYPNGDFGITADRVRTSSHLYHSDLFRLSPPVTA